MGGVHVGTAPDGTEGVVLDFDTPEEENEWRDQNRRDKGLEPEPDITPVEAPKKETT